VNGGRLEHAGTPQRTATKTRIRLVLLLALPLTLIGATSMMAA
jgi:hypothetical protein